MIEGFDTRTLTVIITLLAIIHGVTLCCYAKNQASFHGFWKIGTGFLTIGLGFALVSFRTFLFDWITITFSGLLVIYGIRSIGIGGLGFFNFPACHYRRICNLLLVLQLISSTYYAVFDFNSQIRIVIICTIFSIQCFYLSYKLISIKDSRLSEPVCLLYWLFILCGILFISRALWTGLYYPEAFTRAHTIAYLSSLFAFLLMIVMTSSIIIWAASDRLRQELKRQATIDPLTQVYNRRALETIAAKEIARAQRKNTWFSLVLMDIDLFKQINDKHGHQFGDQVLRQFCRIISENLRNYDIFSRYGGEEFVLLLPNTTGADALKLAEKLREIISQSLFSGTSNIYETTTNESITASFGVAESSNQKQPWDSLLSQADQALYQAKQQGRNKVVHFNEVLTS